MNNLKIIGLIGYPLSHSFSKDYFIKKFEREGIRGFSYINFEIDEIGKIMNVVEDNPGLIGLNVTIPYKQKVLPFLNSLSEEAGHIGAVNTILIDRSGSKPQLTGYNTDCTGFRTALEQLTGRLPLNAMVLGTGGASRAVVYELEKQGIEIILVSRSRREGVTAYQDLDGGLIKKYPLIINTTPLGMYPLTQAKPEIPYDLLGPDNFLMDLVYNPERTLFLQLGEEAGAKTINGMPMLVSQAEAAWEIWTGKGDVGRGTGEKEKRIKKI